METTKGEDTTATTSNTPAGIVDKDKTFNRLKEIQNLLKKESSLNELCKQNNQFISPIYYSYSCKKQFNRKNHREMQRNLYRKIESDD